MSKLNISVFLNSYSDKKGTNSPNLTNFKWARDITGIDAGNPTSATYTLAPSEVKTIFTTGTKKLMYLETSGTVSVLTNGSISETVKAIVVNASVFPGMLLKTYDITSLVVTNPSPTDALTIFVATVE